MTDKYRYLVSCVDSDADSIIAMQEAAREITLSTFKRRCDMAQWAVQMGYDRHLPLHRDRYVTYHRSVYRGVPCYYAEHSRIEYIFTGATA